MLKAGMTCHVGVFLTYFIILSLLYTFMFSFLPHLIEELKMKLENRKQLDGDDSFELEECDNIEIHVR